MAKKEEIKITAPVSYTHLINIVLSKVFKHTSDVFDLSADELQFTEINGRELAVLDVYKRQDTDGGNTENQHCSNHEEGGIRHGSFPYRKDP